MAEVLPFAPNPSGSRPSGGGPDSPSLRGKGRGKPHVFLFSEVRNAAEREAPRQDRSSALPWQGRAVRAAARRARAGRVRFLFAASVLLSTTASALPADARLSLPPGSEKFLRAPIELLDVVTEPEGVISAEVMPSKEIFISAKAGAKGSTTLIAVGPDLVYAWDVCVASCPPDVTMQTAKTACPDLHQENDDGKQIWTVTVKEQKCFDALKNALSHITLHPNDLHIVLEEDVALAFFRRVSAKVAADPRTKGLTAGYYGPTLKLTGEVPRSAVAAALGIAYGETLGAISYDDQTTAPPAPTGKPQ